MNRPLVAALALSTILSIDSTLAFAGSSPGCPPTVLRLRGGASFAGPAKPEVGEGWSAGASVGIVLKDDVLLSFGYDHIALDRDVTGPSQGSISPVTLELEFGAPAEHRLAPHFSFGIGGYFQDQVSYPYFYDGIQPPAHSLETKFGLHVGAGLSVPIWKRTLVDLDYRYHIVDGTRAFEMGTVTAGLRFLFPGGSGGPEGYVSADGSSVFSAP